MSNLYWLTIPELREECAKRGLSTYGAKKDLVERLSKAETSPSPSQLRLADIRATRVEEPSAVLAKLEAYFNKKYADEIALAEKAERGEIKILPYLPHKIEDIPEYTVTPEQLDKYLASVKKDKLPDVINIVKVSISECIGDIIETYRYESTEEGKKLEAYIDSLLAIVKKHEKRLHE